MVKWLIPDDQIEEYVLVAARLLLFARLSSNEDSLPRGTLSTRMASMSSKQPQLKKPRLSSLAFNSREMYSQLVRKQLVIFLYSLQGLTGRIFGVGEKRTMTPIQAKTTHIFDHIFFSPYVSAVCTIPYFY
jgi:hypothetical protein